MTPSEPAETLFDRRKRCRCHRICRDAGRHHPDLRDGRSIPRSLRDEHIQRGERGSRVARKLVRCAPPRGDESMRASAREWPEAARSRPFPAGSARQICHRQLYGRRQGGQPAVGIFCGGFPFFYAAENTEKSPKPQKNRGACPKIVQPARTGHLEKRGISSQPEPGGQARHNPKPTRLASGLGGSGIPQKSGLEPTGVSPGFLLVSWRIDSIDCSSSLPSEEKAWLTFTSLFTHMSTVVSALGESL